MENAISEIDSLKNIAKNAILSLTEEELKLVIMILEKEKEGTSEINLGKYTDDFQSCFCG